MEMEAPFDGLLRLIDKVNISSEVPASVHTIGMGGEENESIF